jgi:uncharacterized protein (UPF0216 family)
MPDGLSYQGILQEYLSGELRVLNAHLPCKQKPLSELLSEKYPRVTCNDGSTHLFKRKELEYLVSMVDADEQRELLLPMLIEVHLDQNEVAIICRGEVEAKVISKIIDIPAIVRQNKITLYKPQLALLRKLLKTTTQYVFSPKISG